MSIKEPGRVLVFTSDIYIYVSFRTIGLLWGVWTIEFVCDDVMTLVLTRSLLLVATMLGDR